MWKTKVTVLQIASVSLSSIKNTVFSNVMSPEKIEIRKFKLKATISSQLLFSQSCALVEKFVKINNKPGTAQVGAISKAQKDSKTKTTFSTTGDNKSSQKTKN